MGKLSVIIYITVALFLLLLISHSPNKSHRNNHHRRHRRLKLRSNFTTTTPSDHHISFDPLVADIERKREDKLWEKTHYFENNNNNEPEHEPAPGMEAQPEWEDFIDAEDYLNDEHKFNITHRLVVLFPSIDVDPADGFVTEHELTEWNLEQSQREVLHRSQREMELHDKNRDGLVSFEEYQPPSWVRDSGPVVMNTSGYSEKGLRRKLAVQALFGKILYLSELPEFCARDSSLIVKEIFGVADEDAERLRLHTVAEAGDMDSLEKMVGGDMDSLEKMVVGVDLDPDRDSDSEDSGDGS